MFRRFLALFVLIGAVSAGSSALGQDEPASLSQDEAEALIQVLENETVRQQLIETLRTASQGPVDSTAEEEQAARQASPADRQSLAREIASFTRDSAESVSLFLSNLIENLGALTDVSSSSSSDYSVLLERLLELAAIILVTIAVFTLLRRFTRVADRRLGRIAETSGLLVSLGALLASMLLDLLIIVASWGAGYAISLYALGTMGQMDIAQSLYLNAFLIIEAIKVGLRGIFAPRFGALRLLPLSDLSAAYWYTWIGRIVSVLGYGSLLIVPLVNVNVGFAAGRGLQILIALSGVVMAVIVVLQNRRTVKQHLIKRASENGDLLSRMAKAFGRVWDVVAIAYVIAFFVIWVSQPQGALVYMLTASGKTIAAILLGFLVVTGISRAISGGLRVPGEMRERLPLLETRLNAFVPKILRVFQFSAFIVVVAAILDAWNVADVSNWIASDTGQSLILSLASAGAILLAAWLLWLAMSSWVEFRLNPSVGREAGARERTLLQLLRNAVTIALAALAAMLVLSEIGVDIGPLLAGAGVLGLAIGFGAQSLVQDVITGVFIQFENAINEGDVITVGGITGTVERLTIRSVGIRDLSGIYHIVPFSAVDTVSNYMRGFAYHVAEIGVAYRENIAEVKEAMQSAFDQLRGTEHGDALLGDLEMHGVTELGDSAVVVRARLKTKPGSQWAVGRAYTEVVKRVFDERGIEIPFPHQTIYWGVDKDGTAPPLQIAKDHA